MSIRRASKLFTTDDVESPNGSLENRLEFFENSHDRPSSSKIASGVRAPMNPHYGLILPTNLPDHDLNRKKLREYPTPPIPTIVKPLDMPDYYRQNPIIH